MLVRVHTLRAQRKSSTNFDCLSDLARQAAFLRNAKVLCIEQPLPFRRVNILIAGHGHSPSPSWWLALSVGLLAARARSRLLGTMLLIEGYLCEKRGLPMSLKSVCFGLAVLVSASSVSMAQSLPNYGPNPPRNIDSFGQPASGAKPPGVSRYGHRAYAYVPNQHRRHYRNWHHRHWY